MKEDKLSIQSMDFAVSIIELVKSLIFCVLRSIRPIIKYAYAKFLAVSLKRRNQIFLR